MVAGGGPLMIDYGTCRDYFTYQQQFITITAQALDNIYVRLTTPDKYAYLIFIYEVNNAEFGLMLVFKKDYIYLYSGPMEDKNLIKKWAWASNKPFHISYYVVPEWVGGEHTGRAYAWYYLSFNYNNIETRVLLGNRAKLIKVCYHGNIDPATIYYHPTPPTEMPSQIDETPATTTSFDSQALMKTMEELIKTLMSTMEPMTQVMMMIMMISIPMAMMRMISEITSSTE